MKRHIGWQISFFAILALALIAGCGSSPSCPDLEGTITGRGDAADTSQIDQGKIKVTARGDAITWTVDKTGYKAIDGVTVRGKLDKAEKGAPRNILDAKADLKGDYSKCQLVVTGNLTGPSGEKPASCQGGGSWQVLCEGAQRANGNWQVGSAAGAAQTPGVQPAPATTPPPASGTPSTPGTTPQQTPGSQPSPGTTSPGTTTEQTPSGQSPTGTTSGGTPFQQTPGGESGTPSQAPGGQSTGTCPQVPGSPSTPGTTSPGTPSQQSPGGESSSGITTQPGGAPSGSTPSTTPPAEK